MIQHAYFSTILQLLAELPVVLVSSETGLLLRIEDAIIDLNLYL
jgi:hypothetical protein